MSLSSRLTTIFELSEYRGGGAGWTIETTEALIPYELEIYLGLIHVKVEARAAEAANR